MTIQPSRRAFIKIAAGTGVGLVIGLDLPIASAAAVESFAPNPFVRVAPDNTVTVLVKHLDKGQGTATGLSAPVAEELDADRKQMHAEFAPPTRRDTTICCSAPSRQPAARRRSPIRSFNIDKPAPLRAPC